MCYSVLIAEKVTSTRSGLTEPLTEDIRPVSQVPKKETYKGKKKKERNKQAPKKPAQPLAETKPEDDGYDGYYDDVQPPDLDRTREGVDKELIKKIVILGVSVLLIISLCVVMMYVL